MSDNNEQSGFRVIDKRNRTEEPEAPAAKTAGEGFVMGEKPEDAAQPHQIDFPTLVYSFATSAMISLGLVQDPDSGQPTPVNLAMAKQNIDILGLLQEKTRGNLTEDEAKMIEHFVTELRMMFVEVSSKNK